MWGSRTTGLVYPRRGPRVTLRPEPARPTATWATTEACRPRGERSLLRRLAPGVLRRTGGHGGRRALPRSGPPRPAGHAGAPARGCPPLRALRGREPDQRPEPGAPRCAAGGARDA